MTVFHSVFAKHAVTVGFKRHWWNPLSEMHRAINWGKNYELKRKLLALGGEVRFSEH